MSRAPHQLSLPFFLLLSPSVATALLPDPLVHGPEEEGSPEDLASTTAELSASEPSLRRYEEPPYSCCSIRA